MQSLSSSQYAFATHKTNRVSGATKFLAFSLRYLSGVSSVIRDDLGPKVFQEYILREGLSFQISGWLLQSRRL